MSPSLDQAKELDNARRSASDLGLPVTFTDSDSPIHKQDANGDNETLRRKSEAYVFFPKGGGEPRIVVNVDRCKDWDTVYQKILHEGAGHYGLQKLFGEDLDTVLDNIWNAATPDLQQRISTRYGDYKKVYTTDPDTGKTVLDEAATRREAVNEYMSRLAEKTGEFTPQERTFWETIKNYFLRLLRSKGFRLKRLTDDDLRNIIRESRRNLERTEQQRRQADPSAPADRTQVLRTGEPGAPEPPVGQTPTEGQPGTIRHSLGDAPETFQERQKKAVENNGTVMPGLNEARVKILEIPKHTYTGNIAEATAQAEKEAKAKYAPEGKPRTLTYDNFGKRFEYSISGGAIHESLNPKQQAKSVNKGAHLSVIKHLDEVINNSIEAEEHPDYQKNKNGERDRNIINENAIMHRFYGAITIDGKTYRTMTLMREDKNPTIGDGVYAYEVQKIEVLDEQSPNTPNGADSGKPDGSTYPLAKLLNKVKKSYDPSKFLLDESENSPTDQTNPQQSTTGQGKNSYSLPLQPANDPALTPEQNRLLSPESLIKLLDNGESAEHYCDEALGTPYRHVAWGDRLTSYGRFNERRRKEGLHIDFAPDGSLLNYGLYHDGRREGMHYTFNPQGDRLIEGAFSNGTRVGTHRVFYDTYSQAPRYDLPGLKPEKREQVRDEITYNQQGRPDGEAYSYSSSGKLLERHIFKNGKLLAEWYAPAYLKSVLKSVVSGDEIRIGNMTPHQAWWQLRAYRRNGSAPWIPQGQPGEGQPYKPSETDTADEADKPLHQWNPVQAVKENTQRRQARQLTIPFTEEAAPSDLSDPSDPSDLSDLSDPSYNPADTRNGRQMPPSMLTDEELLLRTRTEEGSTDDWNLYNDEYDRRHRQEYADLTDHYRDVIEKTSPTLDDAYDMLATADQHFHYGGYASPERTELLAQRDVLEDYITQKETEQAQAEEGTVRYSRVEDPQEISRLESQPTRKIYSAMQLIDGKLYPPMSAKVNGEWRQPSEIGQWERSEENPELADDNGKFKLDKGNKKTVPANYNPYFHTSPTMLNDQFSEAQDRPELVTVEVEIPESELTSGYRAEKAHDTVGEIEWKAGVVTGKISGTRSVILSRWRKPVRIVPTEEVADNIIRTLNGEITELPTNVVTPQVREELEKRGINFVHTNNQGKLTQGPDAGRTWTQVWKENNARHGTDRYSLPQDTTPEERKAYVEERDAEYQKAVEQGDWKKVDMMLREEARLRGYSPDTSYQGSIAFNGAAPSKNVYFDTREQRKQAFNNGDFEGDYSLGDFAEAGLDNNDLEWQLTHPIQASGRDTATMESIRNINKALNSGKRTIKIYRAVDADIKENAFRNGDWVTPSREYAERHMGLQEWKKGRIIEQEVPFDDLWWNGDDINEWGYDDGRQYAYKNTPNNRKLLEPTYDDNGNIIPLSQRFNPSNGDIRFSLPMETPENVKKEMFDIRKQAKSTKTWLKAPNNKSSNLNERQWTQVRTTPFKEWFGDWQTSYQRKYLIEGDPVATLKGEKIVASEGETFKQAVTRKLQEQGGKADSPFGEVLLDYKGVKNDVKHGVGVEKNISFAAVKDVLENGVVILPLDHYRTNEKKQKTGIIAAPITIAGERYACIVEVIANTDSNRLYLHEVTAIKEPQEDVISTQVHGSENTASPDPHGAVAKLVKNILTAKNSSKIVDENGEPLVVYHQTNSTVYINKETGQNWDELDWREKDEWEERDDWDEYWQEQDFYTFDNKNHGRRSIEYPAFFFSPKNDPYHEYGKRTIAVYLNIKNPAINPDIENRGVTDTAGEDAMKKLIEQGYDGVIRTDENGKPYEYIAFFPEQIKSATDNIGTFSPTNGDIRFSLPGGNTNNTPATGPSRGIDLSSWDPLASVRRHVTDSRQARADADQAWTDHRARREQAIASHTSVKNDQNLTPAQKNRLQNDMIRRVADVRALVSKVREGDRESVKAVTQTVLDLADAVGDGLTRGAVKKLMHAVENATTRRDVKTEVDKAVDAILTQVTRETQRQTQKLLHTKATKLDPNNIRVAGQMDEHGQRSLRQLNELLSPEGQSTDLDQLEAELTDKEQNGWELAFCLLSKNYLSKYYKISQKKLT